VRASARSPEAWRALAFSPLALGSLIALAIRAPGWGRPIEPDTQIYLTVGDGLFHGLLPYRDLFDHKGPLAYYLFGGVDALIPRSELAVFVVGFLLFVAAVWRLVALVERHAGTAAARVAAVAFAVGASAPVYEWGDPNLEQIALPFLVGAIEQADRFRETRRLGNAAWAGGCVMAVVLLKPIFGVVAVPAALAMLRAPRQRVLGAATAVAAGVIVAVLAFLPWAGELDAVKRDLWDFNRDYSSRNVSEVLDRGTGATFDAIVNWPGELLWGTALVAAWLAWRSPPLRWATGLSFVWLVVTMAAVKTSLLNFPHYFVLATPCLAILIGLGWAAVVGSERDPRLRRAVAALVLVPLTLGMAVMPLLHAFSDDALFRSTERDRALDPVIGFIHEHSGPDDRIFVSSQQELISIYWLSDRRPASRFLFQSPVRESEAEQLRDELLARPPAVIVVVGDAAYPLVQPVVDALHYATREQVDSPWGKLLLMTREA
jgi:hypothetical protein